MRQLGHLRDLPLRRTNRNHPSILTPLACRCPRSCGLHPKFSAESSLRSENFWAGMIAFWLRGSRNCREWLSALAALQIVRVEAQQIRRTVNESAVRTFPRWHGQRVIDLPSARGSVAPRAAYHAVSGCLQFEHTSSIAEYKQLITRCL
jgi:hypothetical protein